jgi:hypothetical protein
MGAAACIGRVGGLAVALGVGTAIATGYGVASADDTPSNPPSSDTSATSGSTDTNTQTSNEPSTKRKTTEQDRTTTQSGTTTNTVKGHVVVRPQTNAGTDTAEPTTAPTETASPTHTAAPEPTKAPETEQPAKPAKPQRNPKPTPTSSKKASTKTSADQTAYPSPRAVGSVADPSLTAQSTDSVAVFADPRTLAAAAPRMVSPMKAAQAASVDVSQPTAATAPKNPVTAITRLVSNVIGFVLNPSAGSTPTTPAQPPLIWSLLAFARKEFDNFFSALAGGSTETAAPVQRLTSLALAATVNSIPPRPAFPTPGQQLSPSTNFVDWVTGDFLPNNTSQRFSVSGTDVGVMWDNGIPDDPKTPINEHQVLIAVGDTFSGPNMTGNWRSNTLFRSSDTILANGMSIPDGQWFNGNMFGGAPLSSPTTARQIIFPSGLPAGVTLIPTAGISLSTPRTEFGATQYLSYMSVKQWGSPGRWTTNYSAIAYSTDNGENWTVAPTSVRYNQSYSGNKNFQQSAFVMGNDGYVYMYGTPNGRQGAAYVSRVLPQDILDASKYEYYNKGTKGWFSTTPAGWYNDPGKAAPVFGKDGGFFNPGNTVSEMSVQYNQELDKYVVLYGDQFNNIVIRTSDTPQGAWSNATTILRQQNGGIYAPMMHPWSPSTMGTGTDLYWNLSLWSQYDIMLMRTDLTKV